MKKETNGGGSKNPKPKTLGATSLQISEGDASRLIGGIVEKGFSDIRPTRPTAPRPTVLPFPVARHRSHGPHWAPKVGNFNLNCNDNDGVDLDVGEDRDCDGMEVAAGVAKLVERKEKKGLDFSQWKEISQNNNNPVLPEKKKEIGSTVLKIGRKSKEVQSGNLSRKIDDPDEGLSQPAIANELGSFRFTKNRPSNEMQVDLNIKKSEIGGEKESLESQIDAENRDRLAKMSAEEIAEEQAELMAKLDPALINVLKTRAQSKVKRMKFPSSDSTQPENKNTASSDITITSENPVKDNDVNKATGSTNISSENPSMWVAWSKRVECARDLRFSLEGNIIRSVSDSGKASSESGYNADNVSERDFLRTEGDPGAVGYTIKEAVALTRSVIPGQRTFALHLIAAVLDKAISGICQKQVDFSDAEVDVDWEALWAFALGPEPELAFTLRMSLDDNYNYVVLACAKAIQSALSSDMNDTIFDILENTPTYARDVCTAPIFRSKPDVNVGFLRGGFWKYNTKTSNIRCFVDEELKGERAEEGERTIQDDVFVAGQDFAAGLVRMGILPRICYLLETDPTAQLEECLLSILIAVARHSPTCGAAILDCERLVQTVVNRFSSNEQMEINHCKIKSVMLLKVLARLDKKICLKFKNEGILQKMTWHLYRYPFSLDQWLRSGKEACKLSSALLVEQLRFWKVFVRYGYCISEASMLFTPLCIWLSVPSFDNLISNDMMNEYCAITREAYLLLDVLAGRLPNYYSRVQEKTDDEESCSWSFFGSVIDLALEWIQVKNIPYLSKLLNCQNKDDEYKSELNSVLWVISSVLNMFSSVLKAVTPDDMSSLPNCRLPWLPEFVPKMGLKIIKNGYLRPDDNFSENGSLVEYLCHLRTKNKTELGLSSICCLQGLVQVVDSIDKLIRDANLDIHKAPSFCDSFSWEDKVLANGIIKSSVHEVRFVLNCLMKLIISECQCKRPVEIFGRGGPAPGVGVGWGASGGGYWSLENFLCQQDARLLVYLFEITEIPFDEDPSEAMQMVNCALTACLAVGPGDNSPVIDKLLKFIFRAPVLKYLDSGIRKFLSFREGHSLNYEEDEYESFATVLETHFRNRWLSVKKRKVKSMKKETHALETICEDSGEELSSLRVEWAHQRLPLPDHWFLSSISTVHSDKPSDFLEISKGGLFFLMGVEAIPNSPVKSVSVVWKLHAMSVILISGMEILGDEKSRDVYGILQNIYGEIVDEKNLTLQFEKEMHESYATLFVETFVDQFAAESYGDSLFGRQVAMYLRRSVDASVRVAAWNALSNARALELLPRLAECFTKAEGFLEPIEDNERILEAYVKSWVSGALDKAANRDSVTFSLVLHHLSSFLFGNVSGDMLSLRIKLAKSLLRDYSRKHQHEGMMMKLVCYVKPKTSLEPGSDVGSDEHLLEVEKRLQHFKEICDGHGLQMEKLESCVRREMNVRLPV